MKVVEIITAILFLFALVLKIINYPGSSALIVVSLTIISIFYLVFGFAIFNDIKFKNIIKSVRYKTNSSLHFIFAILLGMSLSLLIISMMIKIQDWTTNSNLVIYGMITTLIILALFFFLLKDKIKKKKIIFLRSFIIIGISIFSYFI